MQYNIQNQHREFIKRGADFYILLQITLHSLFRYQLAHPISPHNLAAFYFHTSLSKEKRHLHRILFYVT